MKTLNIIALILVVLIVLVTLMIILFKYFIEKLNNINNLLVDTEKECIDELKRKNEIIEKMIKVASSKFKCESIAFDEVKDLEIDSLDSFKEEKKLNKCYEEILHVVEDNPKSKDIKTLKDYIKKYDNNELKIISLRTFYNKYALQYNNLIKKFPYNIISKFKKLKIKNIIEGKELDINFNNDLEV